MLPETAATKALVALLCSYEVAAIVSGRVPTITACHRRQPLVGVAVLCALAVHFLPPRPRKDTP